MPPLDIHVEDKAFQDCFHRLILLTGTKDAGEPAFTAAAGRRGCTLAELLGDGPLVAQDKDGRLLVGVAVDPAASVYQCLSRIRAGVERLTVEGPARVALDLRGAGSARGFLARLAVFALAVNPWMPGRGRADRLEVVVLAGAAPDLSAALAAAGGNRLVQELSALPGNRLDPASFRQRIIDLAVRHGWTLDVWDEERLHRAGAGAFLAVAQGNRHRDSAIVHLGLHADSGPATALVAKGVCFDTGGVNLKPARGMRHMQHDMNGAAVALGILLAATELRLPLRLDAWLAITDNAVGPEACRPGDVVRAVNGTRIEIVHTDAEGRMVLADALSLACREQPARLLSLATLTGSMKTALGRRYCGLMTTDDALAGALLDAGTRAGERLCRLPCDADYDEALESRTADVLQCAEEGEADHILAARFLSRFVDARPWAHVDLSAARNPKGLGGVAGEVTGFGVALALAWLGREPFSRC